MLQYSGQSSQNLVKEVIWRLPGLLRSTCVFCQGKRGEKSFHTRRILTFTAEFQNGTHQDLNLQKSKGLTSIQLSRVFFSQPHILQTTLKHSPWLTMRQSFTSTQKLFIICLVPPTLSFITPTDQTSQALNLQTKRPHSTSLGPK